MTSELKIYNVAIVGGGLAGLAAAVELAKKGRSVILFEQNTYPFHKVCGEYISNESWNYLSFLGVKLNAMNLPKINELEITTAQGTRFKQPLSLGGFGISRYTLDHELVKIAKTIGVKVLEGIKVSSIQFQQNTHIVHFKNYSYKAEIVLGAYGKRSNLDKSLQRKFIRKPLKDQKNYVAVKYHLKGNLPANKIGLHLFKDGYCGISKVDGDQRYCLCYLTLVSNLKRYKTISEMEMKLLSQNKELKELFLMEHFYKKPETIAQVNFSKKTVVNNHVFMIGDAAGLIVPLCGNGMSMALAAAHQFVRYSDHYFKKTWSRSELERAYKKKWNNQFKLRLKAGRILQKLFYYPILVNPILRFLDKFPSLADKIIELTHGKEIYSE